MAMTERRRRRSLAQNIVGFSADESQGLVDDDFSYFGTVLIETEDSSSEAVTGDKAPEVTVLLPEIFLAMRNKI